MNAYRILFVDDEPSILEALRRVLHRQRRTWDLVFTLDGQGALDELAKAPFDVIVCDLRMPGMDGASLLGEVKERHPNVIRIVLSGSADREAVRTLAVAHQFLGKPCEADTLRETIERACQVRGLLDSSALREVVGRLDRLPSVPHTYWELTRAIDRPDVSVAEIARIVETDPAMTVKVLQLANSAYFGAAQRKVSVSAAVAYLGLGLLKGLALTVHVFSALEGAPAAAFSLEELQREWLMTARLARSFVIPRERAEEAFTAGLVHDIGKVVLATAQPERYGEVVQEARASGRAQHVVEEERLGVTHAAVGAYLLGVWGLPLSIVEVVARHHTPGLAVASPSQEVLAAVHSADVLVHQLRDGVACGLEVDAAFLERAGLIGQLEGWRAAAEAELARGAEEARAA
jgi:HD-like signal output (HDOD) protein